MFKVVLCERSFPSILRDFSVWQTPKCQNCNFDKIMQKREILFVYLPNTSHFIQFQSVRKKKWNIHNKTYEYRWHFRSKPHQITSLRRNHFVNSSIFYSLWFNYSQFFWNSYFSPHTQTGDENEDNYYGNILGKSQRSRLCGTWSVFSVCFNRIWYSGTTFISCTWVQCATLLNDRPGWFLFTERPKTQTGRGRWDLASCQVSMNSVEWYHRSEEKPKIYQPIRDRYGHLCFPIGPKVQTW